MRKPILLLLTCLPALAAGHLCLSATTTNTGNWSAAATWTNCGNSIPGDGDWVVWRSSGTLAIDINVGTVGSGGIKWIRQESGTVMLNAGITLLFASTGANPTGSGTVTNPGADATMFGFFLARGATFQINGTAARRVTIKAANGTSPVYIHHDFTDVEGCTTITNNVCNGSAIAGPPPVGTIAYADIYNLGAGTNSDYFGITWGGSGSAFAALTIHHCQFFSPYSVVSGFPAAPALVLTYQFNYDINPGYSKTIWEPNAGAARIGWVITDNTEVTGTGVNGSFIYFTNAPSGSNIQRNAVYSTATSQRNVLALNTAVATSGGNTVIDNYEEFAEPASHLGTCSGPRWWYTDTASVWKNGICRGGAAVPMFVVGGVGTVQATNSWVSQWKANADSQGNFITYSGGTALGSTHSITNNIMVDEDADSTHKPFNVLAYSTTGTSTVAKIDHNTVIKVLINSAQGIQLGEGTTQGAIRSSTLRSNIVTGGGASSVLTQILAGNANGLSTLAAACPIMANLGLCNNLTYGTALGGTFGMYYKASAVAHWDDGVHPHPNAIYGDLTVNPMLVAPSRRPCGFGVVLGLDGTCPTLFAALAKRALGTSGCTVCGTYTDGGYGANGANVIEAMRLWLFHGSVPQNPQTWCAGHDGETVGAVAFCRQGKAMLAATAF